MPNPFTRRFNVVMDNNEPFEFDWDREELPTQDEVRDLWKSSLQEQTLQLPNPTEQMKPLETSPFKFDTPDELLEQGLEGVSFYGSPSPQGFPNPPSEPVVQKPKTGLGAAYDWATTSFLPERKTENPMYGAQTLSRIGDYVYEKIARPTVSPAGAVATAAGAVSIPARIGLAGIGAATGLYNAPTDISEAIENPTFENIADVGLDVAGVAAPYAGYKSGAFTKPKFQVLGSDVDLPPMATVGQRRLYGVDQSAIPEQNPIHIPPVVEPPPPPPGPVSKVHTPTPGHEWSTLTAEVLDPQTERMFPTVGGVGLSNEELFNPKTGKPYARPRYAPRVGGKGEMGIRGEPFFPAIPERVQTSTTQELFRPVTEMLTRMAKPKGAVTDVTQEYRPGPTVEVPLDASNETYFNQRMLAERASGLEELPAQVLNPSDGLRRSKQGNVVANQGVRVDPKTGRVLGPDPENPLLVDNPEYPNKPVEPIIPEVETVNEGRFPGKKPEDMPGGKHRFNLTGTDRKLVEFIKGKDPDIAKAAAQTAADLAAAKKTEQAKKAGKEIYTSGWKLLDDLGPKGKALSREVQRVRADANVASGTVNDKYRAITDGVSDSDFAHAMDVARGDGSVKLKDPKLEPVVQGIRRAFQEVDRIAKRSGMETLDKEGKSLVTTENIKTPQGFHEYIHEMVSSAYTAERFGPNAMGDAASRLRMMIDATENPQQARRIMNKQFGKEKVDPDQAALANKLGGFEAATKLTLHVINNFGGAPAIGMRSSLGNFGKALGQTMKGVSAEDTGAINSTMRAALAESSDSPWMQSVAKRSGWNWSEKFLRNWAGNAGKLDSERLFAQLKRDPKNPTARQKLDDLLLEDVDSVMKQDALTDAQKKRAGYRMAELSQGLVDGADLPPIWSDSPLYRVPLMFKRYAFDTSRNLKNLWASNKTPKDKAAMLAKFVTLYGATGELLGDTTTGIRAGISGNDPLQAIKDRGKPDESPNDLQKSLRKFYKGANIDEQLVNRLLEDIGGSYALGLVGQLAGDASDPLGQRLVSTIAGPAVGDVAGVAGGVASSVMNQDWRPAVRAGVRHLTPLGYSTSKWFDKPKKKKAPGGLIFPTMPDVTFNP